MITATGTQEEKPSIVYKLSEAELLLENALIAEAKTSPKPTSRIRYLQNAREAVNDAIRFARRASGEDVL